MAIRIIGVVTLDHPEHGECYLNRETREFEVAPFDQAKHAFHSESAAKGAVLSRAIGRPVPPDPVDVVREEGRVNAQWARIWGFAWGLASGLALAATAYNLVD